MRDHDLRASLLAIGPLLPLLEHEGKVIDGRRRDAICRETGVQIETHTCSSLQEACSTLWARTHSQRAVELARAHGARSVLELAQLCGARPAAIAATLQDMKPRREHRRKVRLTTSETPIRKLAENPKMLRRLVSMEPELYAYAKEGAAQRGHRNVNKFIRDAMWKAIVETVPNAPLHAPRRVQPPNGARRKAG